MVTNCAACSCWKFVGLFNNKISQILAPTIQQEWLLRFGTSLYTVCVISIPAKFELAVDIQQHFTDHRTAKGKHQNRMSEPAMIQIL